MRILVTGVGGFVGRHLVRELLEHGHNVAGTDMSPSCSILSAADYTPCDLLDPAAVQELVGRIQPEGCVHLGGISFVPAAWEKPAVALSVNVIGTTHLLDAVKARAPACRCLTVSSSHVYGSQASARAIREDEPLAPDSLYAVSKAAADQVSRLYARHHGLHTVVARPANHVGPGQSAGFVVPAFASQVKAIASGRQPPSLRVGNLDSTRDFTDVRDVAAAYRLLLERGSPGEAYNISAGRPVSMRWLLDQLCRLASVAPETVLDPDRYRPTDASPVLDTARLRNDTGWAPRIALETTLRDVLESL